MLHWVKTKGLKTKAGDLRTLSSVWPTNMFIIGTPIDLTRVIKMNKPSQRVRYELQEIGQPTLQDILMKKFGKK